MLIRRGVTGKERGRRVADGEIGLWWYHERSGRRLVLGVYATQALPVVFSVSQPLVASTAFSRFKDGAIGDQAQLEDIMGHSPTNT